MMKLQKTSRKILLELQVHLQVQNQAQADLKLHHLANNVSLQRRQGINVQETLSQEVTTVGSIRTAPVPLLHPTRLRLEGGLFIPDLVVENITTVVVAKKFTLKNEID